MNVTLAVRAPKAGPRREHATIRKHGAQLDATRRPKRLRVYLLGCGAVAGEVLEHLCRESADYELCGMLAQDARQRVEAGVAHELIALNPIEALERILCTSTDVVVEALGGVEPAYRLVMGTLAAGKYCVTANKQLVARHWQTLKPYTEGPNSRLRHSPALGGDVGAVIAELIHVGQRLRAANEE
jgi:homoserine dehydrogenase